MIKARTMKAAVVVADFYADIATALLESCNRELAAAKVQVLRTVHVPGAMEIPFALKTLAKQYALQNTKPNMMIALGCVVRGETYHFEIVSDICARGILQVQLETGVPIGNGVLTTESVAQAKARTDKGADAAKAALRLAKLCNDW